MRRKKNVLIPVEVAILSSCIDLESRGVTESHGYLIAKKVSDHSGAKTLTSHGTLYKALGRMETAGLLSSRWEDPMLAAQESRPRRRFYQVTAKGVSALQAASQPNAEGLKVSSEVIR